MYHVAAAENTGAGRHTVRPLTGDNKAAVVDLDSFGSGNDAGCGSLTNSQDHAVAGNNFLTALGHKLTIVGFGDILH